MSEPTLLEATDITKAFGGVRAVDNVSVAVREGTIHALIGPNGAGKTTFFNAISGFTFPDHGRVTFRGADVTRTVNWRRIVMGMGRTFQTPSVFPELTSSATVSPGASESARCRLPEGSRDCQRKPFPRSAARRRWHSGCSAT